MTIIIPIQSIANQSFSIVLDNNQWDFGIKYTNGVTSVSLTLNNTIIMQNMRVVAGTLIIPAEYQEHQSGNFLFATRNFELPVYTQFGTTQTLLYFTNAELMAQREPSSLPITASDFNSIAALPLRFSPQGYVLA